MRLEDLTVEVRDKDLRLVGLVPNDDLILEASALHNDTGAWKLTLPSEHQMAKPLQKAGSGLVISDKRDVILSGPTTSVELSVSPNDRRGTVEVEGVGDEIILGDRLAFPQPSNADPATQNVERDHRSGPRESLIHAFVSANVGPGAPASRKHPHLLMGENKARGNSTDKSARFQSLGDLVKGLAGNNLGYRIVQRDRKLVFETYEVFDRRADYPLSLTNDSLAGYRIATSPPQITRAIVGGPVPEEAGASRDFLYTYTDASVAAEENWGRRIERFIEAGGAKNEDGTPNLIEMQQAADEILSVEGFAGLGVQAVPTEDTLLVYGRDWFLGDVMSVDVDGLPVLVPVTGYVLKVGPDGVRHGIVLGDDFLLDPASKITRRLARVGSRTASLETTK